MACVQQTPLYVEQGDTYAKNIWYKPGGVAADLTGCTARMQIRQTIGSATVIHSLTTENSGITITAAEGKISLLISATDTAAFTFNSPAAYDLELIFADGTVKKILRGSVYLILECTRA